MVFPSGTADKLIWNFERNGLFSVKSCYRLIMDLSRLETSESSNVRSQQKLWKALWKMPVPNKIKVFAWRACMDSLPSKVKLMQKQVQAFWAQFFPMLHNLSPSSFVELAMQFVAGQDLSNLARFFCFAWGFWFRRNKLEFDHKILSPSHVISLSLGLLHSYKAVVIKSRMQARSHFSWKAPPVGVLKLNTDGAIFSDAHKAGIGAILCDSSGHVLMAVSKIELALEDPKTVELLAVFRGMQLCISMGISALEVESDCLLLVQALQQEDMSNSLLGNLFSEVKRLCNYFSSVSFVHVYREGNRAAHLLARNAWRVEDIDMWWDSIPDFLSQALWFDKCL
ncbi:uncharacterized protein LOC122294624 [Carya illinoinensis]|uniref:uncharacterized protein LOC122294624 n=1 Tax=Carya illinoinensis TaxID=32201 RepID=UPI001C71E3DE|nr:uncharacterized protein LOC122294624 [Carya illinoinensis]